MMDEPSFQGLEGESWEKKYFWGLSYIDGPMGLGMKFKKKMST